MGSGGANHSDHCGVLDRHQAQTSSSTRTSRIPHPWLPEASKKPHMGDVLSMESNLRYAMVSDIEVAAGG